MPRRIRRTTVGEAVVDDPAYVVAEPVAPVAAERVVPVATERHVVTRRRFDPAAVLVVAFGVALGIVGAVAIARAGFDGPMDEPVVDVAGFTHTTVLGLIELGAGLLLVWAGLSRDRSAMLFVTILLGAAALVAAIEPTVGGDTLSIERSWAVLVAIVCAVLALVTALAPTIFRSSERVDVI